MPIMDPSTEEEWHEEETPLTQARRDVCSTLRRAVRKILRTKEEHICFEILDSEKIDDSDWYVLNRYTKNMQQIADLDLLRLVALYAPNPKLQLIAIRRLFHEGPRNDSQTQWVLDELLHTSTDKRVLGIASRVSSIYERANARMEEETSGFWDTRRTQKSILNPYLPTLCANGTLDPDDLEDRALIEYLVHAQGHSALSNLLPEDRLSERITRWWRDRGTTYLLARENDLDALEDYVLHGSDEEMRAIVFSRLTGFWHWEICDSFSHVTYGCTPVSNYDGNRALRLCEEVLATTEPYMPRNYPTPPIDALREGARQVTEHTLYGRVFWNDLTYVGEYARAAAVRLGQTEGVEHWLLGCLQFSRLSSAIFLEGDFPYIDFIDAKMDIKDSRQLLAQRRIDGDVLSKALLRVLADGDVPNHEYLLDYFDAAQRYAWHGEPGATTVCDLLKVILRCPTEAICRAMNRLALLSVLE